MRFIELTDYDTGRKIYINMSMVRSISRLSGSDERTRLEFGSVDDAVTDVKELPYEITSKI